MLESLAHVNVLIIGHEDRLRSINLASINEEVSYISPVYVKNERLFSRILKLPYELFLNGRSLKNGERGCSLAHIEARRQAEFAKYDWSLILEDDVDLPENWLATIATSTGGLEGLSNCLILLNTNPYLSHNAKFEALTFKPSYANAYLIHRSVVLSRKYRRLEKYEIADWPISFSRTKFYSIDGIAVDVGAESQIGPRRMSRTYFIFNALIRFMLSPIIALILGVSLWSFLKWNVVGPVHKDLYLRTRWHFRSREVKDSL